MEEYNIATKRKMEKINTTAKGDAYEHYIAEQLESLIQAGKFPGVSQCYGIYPKEKYYCSLIDRTIIVDLSIETYVSEEDKKKRDYSTLTIIECKSYEHTVDIADFNEFRTNIKDIGDAFGHVKGYMVTTRGFSAKTIDIAQKLHIGLIVARYEMQWEWKAKRQINRTEKIRLYWSELMGLSSVSSTPIIYQNNEFVTIGDMFEEVGISNKNSFSVPFIKEEDIKAEAEKLFDNELMEILKNSRFPSSPRCYDTLKMAKDFVQDLGYIIQYLPTDCDSLGFCDMENKIISVSNRIDTHRQRFTIAHEIGHIILHSKLFDQVSFFGESNDSVDVSVSVNSSNTERMEIQANMFASYLLLPDLLFKLEVFLLFKEFDIHKHYFYVDRQKCNLEQYYKALERLEYRFNVSKEVLKIRMQKCGYLKIEEQVTDYVCLNDIL